MAAIRFLKTSTHKAKHQIHLSSSSALSAKTHENLSIKTQQKPSISFAPIIPHFQEEIDTENEGKSVMRAQQKMANRNQEETLISLLKLCSTMDQLRQIHAQALCTSLIHHPSILRHLLSFVALSSPSNMNYARLVFAGIRKPEVYLYNTMLRGYSLSESPEKALFFYKQMRKIGVNTDAFASSFTLKSCANLLAVFEGKQIHCRIIQDGYEPDVFLLTSLMDMYARCHHRDDAHRVFDIMPRRDTVVWNVLISCFLQNSRTRDAMKLFEKMVTEDGAHPDNVTCLLTLQACANLGALDLGERVHEYMDQRGIGNAINLCNSLIDMYAKCGCLDKAYIVFREMMKRNVVTWTTMISGLAMHGHGRMALDAFDAMLRSGVEPDEHTLTGVLSACSHAGLVDDGHAHFHDLIHGKYKIVPNLHHYGCMVDLLGRAGMLEQAYGIISSMHAKPDATIWRTLLGACRIHGHACLGEKVMGHLVELNAQQAGDYVLLTNIYASKGNWDGVANLRKVMKDDGIQTSPGWSSIEANGEIYEFVVDDNSHPRSKEIYAMLEEMERQLKNSGYAVNMAAELHDSDLEMREKALSYHSEKIAIAFALISTPPGMTIRITKNLRICVDCHSVAKVLSRIYNREIIVRDRSRFHHFREGLCSCNDYW